MSVVVTVAPTGPSRPRRTIRRCREACVWQVIAIGRANLQLTAIALAMGGNARAGMEDTLYLGKGRPADGNDELVARAVSVARELDRDIATVDEAAKALSLPS